MFDIIVAKLKEDVVDVAINVRHNNYTFRYKDGNKIRIEFISGKSHYSIIVNDAEVIRERNYFRGRRLYKLIQKLMKKELQKELFPKKFQKSLTN